MALDLTKYTRASRPITDDDLQASMRGLELYRKRHGELTELIQRHARLDMFASAVIVNACAARLVLTGQFDPDDYSVAELEVMLLSPGEGMRGMVTYALGERAPA